MDMRNSKTTHNDSAYDTIHCYHDSFLDFGNSIYPIFFPQIEFLEIDWYQTNSSFRTLIIERLMIDSPNSVSR